jgi:hypothetical protein
MIVRFTRSDTHQPFLMFYKDIMFVDKAEDNPLQTVVCTRIMTATGLLLRPIKESVDEAHAIITRAEQTLGIRRQENPNDR